MDLFELREAVSIIRQENPSWGRIRIAKELNEHPSRIRRAMDHIRSVGEINTPEDKMAAAGIDPSKWAPQRAWITAKGGVSVSLARAQLAPGAIADEVVERMKKHAPVYQKIKRKELSGDHFATVEAPDLHLGKLGWRREVGSDYDIGEARNRFRCGVDDILHHISYYKPERIAFVVGNDFLHADTLDNTTTAGTRQDVDTRVTKIFGDGLELLVEAIEKIRILAPVVVPVIPGNHDALSMFHLGVALDAWFRNDDDVCVDAGPSRRKYVRWRDVLIGMTHGGKGDPKYTELPLVMATERPADWAECTTKEWRVGHQHRKGELRHVGTFTNKGVIVRIGPSLSSDDQWHFANGYVGAPKFAEGYVYKAGYGVLANFCSRQF